MATELGGMQVTSLMEALPGIASVLRNPVADAFVGLIRAGARLGDFKVADAEEILRYAVRRTLMTQDETERVLAEVHEATEKRAEKAAERERGKAAKKAAAPVAEPKRAEPVEARRPEPAEPKRVEKKKAAPAPAPAAKKAAPKKAAPKPAAKSAAKAPAKAAAKPAAKKRK